MRRFTLFQLYAEASRVLRCDLLIANSGADVVLIHIVDSVVRVQIDHAGWNAWPIFHPRNGVQI